MSDDAAPSIVLDELEVAVRALAVKYRGTATVKIRLETGTLIVVTARAPEDEDPAPPTDGP